MMKEDLSTLKCTFFCIHGNHENRPQNIASCREKEWHGGRVLYEEDFPNILFPVDGDIFEIDGKQCLVIGGAYSVDKFYRLRMSMSCGSPPSVVHWRTMAIIAMLTDHDSSAKTD